MAAKRDKPKYQIIFDDLRAAIRKGTYGADEQLPSERELAEQYRVTRTTARRALSDLEQMGLVRREGARGTRVLPDRNGARTEILTLVCSTEPLASASEFLRQATLLTDRKGWGSRILRLSFDEPRTFLRSLNVGNPHLIYSERLDFDAGSRLTDIVSHARTPVVMIGNDLSDQGVPSIICDDLAGMNLALNHLRDLGHTQVALVCGREDTSHPVLRTMIGTWESFMQERLDAEAISAHLIRMEDHPFESLIMEAYDMVRAYLRGTASKSVTAMICLKEELAIGAVAACRDLARPVPESMSVVEYAPTPRAKLATIPRTLIDVHLDRHVERAVNLIMKQKPGAPLKRNLLQLIQPTLVTGQSVKRR